MGPAKKLINPVRALIFFTTRQTTSPYSIPPVFIYLKRTSINSIFSIQATRWPLFHKGRSWPKPIFRGALYSVQYRPLSSACPQNDFMLNCLQIHQGTSKISAWTMSQSLKKGLTIAKAINHQFQRSAKLEGFCNYVRTFQMGQYQAQKRCD